MNSSLLSGVGQDAAELADHIAARRSEHGNAIDGAHLPVVGASCTE